MITAVAWAAWIEQDRLEDWRTPLWWKYSRRSPEFHPDQSRFQGIPIYPRNVPSPWGKVAKGDIFAFDCPPYQPSLTTSCPRSGPMFSVAAWRLPRQCSGFTGTSPNPRPLAGIHITDTCPFQTPDALPYHILYASGSGHRPDRERNPTRHSGNRPNARRPVL